MPNLLPLPSNAFSGAAVKFNNNDIDKFLLQNTYAKNQARDLALTKYFGTLNNRLTPAGMDTGTDEDGHSDLKDFTDAKQKWSDFAVQNRRAINAGDPRATALANQYYNEAMDIIQKSKGKMQNLAQLKPVLDDPAKRALLPPSVMDNVHLAQLGVNNPRRQPIDMSKVDFNPKPWSGSDEMGLSNEVNKIKGVPQTPSIAQNATTGMQTVTTENKFDTNSLNSIYSLGASTYERHGGFHSMIDNMITSQNDNYMKLKDLYKSHFGVDATHPEDIAAAYALSRNGTSNPTVKNEPIPGYSDIAQNKKAAIARVNAGTQLNKQEQLHDYEGSHPSPGSAAATPPQDSEGYLQNIETRAKANPTTIQTTINGRNVDGKPTDLDPKIASVFAGTNAKKTPPDLITIDKKTGDYIGTWYKKDENGVPIKSPSGNTAISKSLPPQSLSRESVKQGLNEAFLPKKEAGKGLPPAAPAKVPANAHVGMLNDLK